MPAAVNEDENLWSRVLDDVQSRSAGSFPLAAVVALGDNECGKTTLIARLRNSEDPKKGAGLEYHYLDVNPDYKDGTYAYQLGSALPDVGPGESARLGVWILDGDPVHSGLIRFALSSAPLDKCVVLLCASMTQPWLILDSLNQWAQILSDHVDRSGHYDRNLLRDAKDRQVRFWQEYVEPLDSSTHSEGGGKVPSMETDTSHILLPLGEFVLTENTGLPIVVVITKCDYTPTLEKECDFKDEQFDFIQVQIRKFCLRFGAALVYTSVKEGRNCDLLYKYLLHRIYGFPFTQPALVVEKDGIFIPAGWDNEKKISIVTESLVTIKSTDSYSDVIQKAVHVRRPMTRDQEVHAEDEQHFLMKQLQILNSQAPPPAAAAAPSATPSRMPDGPKLPNAANTTSEGVLANFFNTLLTKKTGAAAPGGYATTPLKGEKGAVTNVDASAELERMLKQLPPTRSATVDHSNSTPS